MSPSAASTVRPLHRGLRLAFASALLAPRAAPTSRNGRRSAPPLGELLVILHRGTRAEATDQSDELWFARTISAGPDEGPLSAASTVRPLHRGLRLGVGEHSQVRALFGAGPGLVQPTGDWNTTFA